MNQLPYYFLRESCIYKRVIDIFVFEEFPTKSLVDILGTFGLSLHKKFLNFEIVEKLSS